jgi:hypothetical protein
MFDRDVESVARTMGRNPMRVVVPINAVKPGVLSVTVSNNHVVGVTLRALLQDEEVWAIGPRQIETGGEVASLEFDLSGLATEYDHLEVVLEALDADAFGYVHVREFEFR